jgi:hypothetical protein
VKVVRAVVESGGRKLPAGEGVDEFRVGHVTNAPW